MTHFTEPHLLSGMPKDTPILLALSGGADSRALLHMLLSYGAPLAVAHVEHGIRGESSLRDLKFCETLAKEASIPFYALQTDVPTLAKQNHMGLEEQARAERYRFFEKIMREQNIPILATAHNATDNAETFLFRMARGTGLAGLSGIAPTRPFGNGVLIRPLLRATKEEILTYCEKNALAFVTDETNADISYARNRIRHRLLPEMTALNGEAVRHISELCRTLREDEDFLTDTAREILEKEETNGVALATLVSLPPAIQNRVLALLFGEPPLSAKNREELLTLAARGTPHAELHLSDGRRACVENGKLLAAVSSDDAPAQTLAPTPVHLGATALFGEKMLLVLDHEASPHEMWKTAKNIYKNATTIFINSDKIRNGLFVRTRQAGDTVLLHGQHKKLRKLQNEAALPLSLRARLPLLCDKDGILWAPLTALRDGIGENANLRVTLFY